MRPMRLPVARTGRTGRTGHTERTGRTGRTGRTEGGSVLMLVPAGFLILMLFAGIAVDSAAAYLGQRQLSDALSAAANDAATAGLDDADYYGRAPSRSTRPPPPRRSADPCRRRATATFTGSRSRSAPPEPSSRSGARPRSMRCSAGSFPISESARSAPRSPPTPSRDRRATSRHPVSSRP
jgi:hypothetical protein